MAGAEPRRPLWMRALQRLLRPQLRAWRGELPLSTAFWGHGVFVSLVLILAFIDALLRRDELTQQVLLTLFLAYTPWSLIAIWRCADNASPPWDTITRLILIAWAANTLMVAGFLQLEKLLSRHSAAAPAGVAARLAPQTMGRTSPAGLTIQGARSTAAAGCARATP